MMNCKECIRKIFVLRYYPNICVKETSVCVFVCVGGGDSMRTVSLQEDIHTSDVLHTKDDCLLLYRMTDRSKHVEKCAHYECDMQYITVKYVQRVLIIIYLCTHTYIT
jgi:hypothetical protein